MDPFGTFLYNLLGPFWDTFVKKKYFATIKKNSSQL